jgi:hypothetical protein
VSYCTSRRGRTFRQEHRPYTDLLLHDMGPELADNFPQGVASGQEWRTAPLWGLGLLSSLNASTRYLHDGRAGSIEEAILWHAGQGQASRDRFKAFTADDRQKLIVFLKSLWGRTRMSSGPGQSRRRDAQRHNAIEALSVAGVQFQRMTTVSLGGKGEITHLINGRGATAKAGSEIANLAQ